jgi:Tol biopolymer transport system component
MALAPGTKLGPYEILAPLGTGGMGEVYRARDTRLERTVAIKILPAHFSCDPVRKQRFEREAKSISNLNHPNICVLYDVGRQDGVDYLVMECVEGETLAKRLEKGALPLDQVVKYGAQIACALDKAHRAGIVHRDLKPGNIMLTPSGAKLLDFGLAKPVAPLANLATLTATKQQPPVTEQGTVVGTFQYMSPEQVEGKEIDSRSDIFSLGAVLYEMVTGQRAFQGKSQLSVASAILEKEPAPISSLKPRTPPAMDHATRRCLAKDPEERWQTTRDLALELKWVAESGSQVNVAAATASHHKLRARLTQAAAILLAVVAAITSWVAWRATRPTPRPLIQLNAELAPDATLVRRQGGSLALSPDGRLLASVVRGADGRVQLGTRRLDQSQLTVLANTEGAMEPFFSPDSRWIAFSDTASLKKISVEGGAPVTICDRRNLGGSWGDDGTIVASLGVGVGLSRIPPGGGEPLPLTTVDYNKGEFAHRWPQVLPGSQAVLFTVYAGALNADNYDIDVVSLKAGKRKTVYHGGYFARYLPSGHLVFVHQNTLFAVPFDLQRLAVIGSPQPVLQGILNQFDEGGYFAFSQNGTFVYVAGKAELPRSIFWMDAQGRTKPLEPAPGFYASPQFSPDGKHLAFSLDDGQGHSDIWIHNLESNTTARLTSLAGRNLFPVWTPDGKGIVFSNFTVSHSAIYWMRSDGSGEAQKMTSVENQWRPQAISRDGKWLAVIVPGGTGGVPIAMVPIEEDSNHPRLGKAVPFLETPFITISPVFSPDGRWVAYRSGEPGKRGIWVQPFPGPGGQWQVSAGPDEMFPIWSRDGHQLFFLADGRIMVADYSVNGDSFVPSKPRVWSEKRLLDLGSPPFLNYDLAPDGKRFAVILYPDGTAEEKPITHVTFLLNFFDELGRRVSPAKN